MKKLFLLTFAFLMALLLVAPQVAQAAGAPETEWAKCYGGAKNDALSAVCLTGDGGYATAGYTNSNEGDIPANANIISFDWVMRLGGSTNISWSRIYNYRFFPQSISQAADMSLSVTERVSDYNILGDSDFRVCTRPISATGSLRSYVLNPTYYSEYFRNDGLLFYQAGYSKRIESENPAWTVDPGISDAMHSPYIYRTKDGGYIAVCSMNAASVNGVPNHSTGTWNNPYDILLLKLNASHQVQWTRMLGGAGDEAIGGMAPTADGGFVIAAYTNSVNGDISGSHGSQDAWIIKLDSACNVSWKKCYGGSGDDIPKCIVETANHGYAVVCNSKSANGDVSGNHGGGDIWTFCTDSAGTLLWQKCSGGSDEDDAAAIVQTADGGFVIAGTTYSTNGDVAGHHGTQRNADGWLVRLKPAAQLTAPANVKAAAAGSGIKISWNAVTGANGYEVWKLGANKQYSLLKSVTALNYTDAGLLGGTACTYKVRAYKNGTPKTYGLYSGVVSATVPLAAPAKAKAASASYNSVKITWNRVSGADGYEVWKRGADQKYKLLKSIKNLYYTDTGLTAGTTCHYEVRAYKNGAPVLYSPFSAKVSAKPIPAAPSGVKAKPASQSIKISWGKVSGATKYEIYYARTKTGNYQLAGTSSSASFTHAKLKKGSYYYKVKAYRLVNGKKVYGSFSAIASAKL